LFHHQIQQPYFFLVGRDDFSFSLNFVSWQISSSVLSCFRCSFGGNPGISNLDVSTSSKIRSGFEQYHSNNSAQIILLDVSESLFYLHLVSVESLFSSLLFFLALIFYIFILFF